MRYFYFVGGSRILSIDSPRPTVKVALLTLTFDRCFSFLKRKMSENFEMQLSTDNTCIGSLDRYRSFMRPELKKEISFGFPERVAGKIMKKKVDDFRY